MSEELKKSGDALKAEIKNLGEASAATKTEVDKALTETIDARARLSQLEQLMAKLDASGGRNDQRQSIGQTVIDSAEYKAFAAKPGKGSVSVDVKQTITSLTTDADGSAGDLVRVDRVPGVIVPAQRRMTIRNLLAPGRTDSNMVEYVKESGFTNAAAIQTSEGADKAESTMKFDLAQAPVRTIAHFVRASRQILSDAAGLQSHIDVRLRFGLMLKEEDQLLNGSGTGVNLSGLIVNSTVYSPAFVPTHLNRIDTIRLAMLQAAVAEWPASGIVLNPLDWAAMELTKDEEGRYVFANPQNLAAPALWGLPVVATAAMADDKFLVGAFSPAAQIFDNGNTRVEVSTEDNGNFTKNLVTILAEQRLTLVVYRSEALIYGDFGES